MKNTTTTTTTSTLSHYILHTCTTNTIAPKAHNMAPITSAISGTCTSTCTRGGTQFSCILCNRTAVSGSLVQSGKGGFMHESKKRYNMSNENLFYYW